MNTATTHQPPGGAVMQTPGRQGYLTIGLLLLALIFAFWPTVVSMVSIWWRSETFTHGFLILPISLALIWWRREYFLHIAPTPVPGLAIVIAGLGLLWLLARFADVLVIEQFAFVSLVVTAAVALLGWRISREIMFPLGFLFFAVPIGEGLIPPMMDFTAVFTVKMLQFSGIPVFKEGTFFEIPSGRWSVVEGCSGVRYLIASITLGVLYAYITYRSLTRRLIFIAFAIIMPVIANGLRAYMIVMIAHLSDMTLALGVDHFIYGWVFFGLVIMLMFWIGSYWREDDKPLPATTADQSMTRSAQSQRPWVIALTLVVIAGGVWPVMALVRQVEAVELPATALAVSPAGSWSESAAELTAWRPRYVNPDLEFAATYDQSPQRVMLYLGYYADQRQGAELINSQNVLVAQKHPEWRQVASYAHPVTVNGARVEARVAHLRSTHNQNLVILYWYWLDGWHTSNHYLAKAKQALDRLLGRPRHGAVILLAAEYDETPKAQLGQLERFAADMLPPIEQSLRQMGDE